MDAPSPLPFLALSPDEAEARVIELGGRAFHARICRREIFERGVLDFEEMTALPKALRKALAETHPILSGTEVARSTAPDDTTKLLVEFPGPYQVETVHIPSLKSGRGATVCVSSQIGCPVGCPFCASGLLGLDRNLAAHEIVEQFLRARAVGPLARAVVMGIGEPLLNFTNLQRALGTVRDELGLGARKLTVSTVGFPERVRRAAEQKPRFMLAISLHTPFDKERDVLVPAMAGTPIEEVLEAGDYWFECTGREITYEYVLLGGTNDTPEHAEELAERLSRRRATVNLIPYNPVPTLPYGRPDPRDVEGFQAHLADAGLVATVRWSRGLAADAACGQLRART